MANGIDPSSSSQNSPEPRGLPHILLYAFGFLSALLFSRRHQFSDTIPTQDSANRERTRGQDIPPPPVRVIVDSVPPSHPPPKQWDAEKKKERRLNLAGVAVSLLTFLGVLYYAHLTNGLLKKAGEANELTVTNMHFDQRAWVGPSSQFVSVKDVGIHNDSRGLTGTFFIPIKNFGKTPAHAVMATAQFESEVPKLNNASKRSCDLLGPFIGVDNQNRSTYFDPGMRDNRWGRVLFPNGEQNIGVGSAINNPPKPGIVYAIGCVVYRDIFREAHWTRFCYESVQPVTATIQPVMIFEQCNTNNYTDEAYPEDKK